MRVCCKFIVERILKIGQYLGSYGKSLVSRFFVTHGNNNNNNSHDNVYGAVIVTKVIARVHPVHLMNVD